jgi:hypothetical protein
MRDAHARDVDAGCKRMTSNGRRAAAATVIRLSGKGDCHEIRLDVEHCGVPVERDGVDDGGGVRIRR